MPDVQSTKKQLHMQQWAAIIEDRIASGLKIDEYCEKNQLSRNSYFYWLRKIREEMSTSVLPDHNDLLPASVSTKALVELVPSSNHNAAIPKIEITDEKPESFGFSVNGISITVGHDISEELLSKIMRCRCPPHLSFKRFHCLSPN